MARPPRTSVFGAAHFALTDAVELYAEASYSRNRQRFVIQPSPLSDQFNLPDGHPLFNQAPYNRGVALGGAPSPFAFATVVLSPTSPFYPTATVQSVTGGATPDILVRYRSVVTGNRDWTDTAEQPRGVLGARGTVIGWNYDAGFLYGETKLTERYNNGAPLYSQILPLLNSEQVNFFGPNTPEIDAQLQATNFVGDAYKTKTSIESFNATASRDLWTLPAGSLALAVGAEWRQEKFSADPSAAMQIGDISTYGGNQLPMSRSRNVTAFLAELKVPIVHTLEADLAVRYDDYPAGDHQVRMEFAYQGGGLGKGGTATLRVDGKKVGEGKVGATAAMVFSADDGCDVGRDTGAPVSEDYGPHGNDFTGRIKGVQISIGEDAEATDHLVVPEEAVRIAMARQ